MPIGTDRGWIKARGVGQNEIARSSHVSSKGSKGKPHASWGWSGGGKRANTHYVSNKGSMGKAIGDDEEKGTTRARCM